MDTVATTIAGKGLNFKLREGFSAETSGMYVCVYVCMCACMVTTSVTICNVGGLLTCLPRDTALQFCKEIEVWYSVCMCVCMCVCVLLFLSL